jgi:hypothetical protein
MVLSDVIALKRALSSWAHRLSWPVVRAYFEPLLEFYFAGLVVSSFILLKKKPFTPCSLADCYAVAVSLPTV